LRKKIFDSDKAYLKQKGITMKQGAIIEATLIPAPISTKDKPGERDPDM
jgi:IS5 family transposase